jgi:hypothetical protein
MTQRLRLLGEDRKPRATSPTLFLTVAKVRLVSVNGTEVKKPIRPEDAPSPAKQQRASRRLSRAITNDFPKEATTAPAASPQKPAEEKLPKLPSLPDLEEDSGKSYSFKVNPAVASVQRRGLSRALSVATPERREKSIAASPDQKPKKKHKRESSGRSSADDAADAATPPATSPVEADSDTAPSDENK